MFDIAERAAFASDAERLLLAGVACLMVSGLALWMDRARGRRSSIERVGWVPWTGMFLLFGMGGAGLVALSLPVVVASM